MTIKFYFETITKFKYIIVLFIFSYCTSPKTKEKQILQADTTKINTLTLDGDSIKIPIYSIDSLKFNKYLDLLDKNKSKITIAPLFENSSLRFSDSSSLILYGMMKEDKSSDSVDYEKSFRIIQKSSNYIMVKFYPFVISNMDIGVKELQKSLKKLKYENLYFVPFIEKSDKDSLYHLNFSIVSGRKVYDYMLLGKIISLNPCPPARPAEYR